MATRLTGVNATLRELEREIEGALADVIEAHAARIATEARAHHPYTDRTRTLTESIEALPSSGNALDGQLRGFVVAGAEYASYLEEGDFAFLEPAARRLDGELARAADAAIEQATK